MVENLQQSFLPCLNSHTGVGDDRQMQLWLTWTVGCSGSSVSANAPDSHSLPGCLPPRL